MTSVSGKALLAVSQHSREAESIEGMCKERGHTVRGKARGQASSFTTIRSQRKKLIHSCKTCVKRLASMIMTKSLPTGFHLLKISTTITLGTRLPVQEPLGNKTYLSCSPTDEAIKRTVLFLCSSLGSALLLTWVDRLSLG